MFNFEICFERPWWLLLLIPAALLTFIPYFRIKKRYRRTRNRIISVVLHSLVMVLSISLLSGFYVRYYVPNEENEMILLVDVSDTGAGTVEKRDTFIETVIEECSYENIRVGVVTFGFDQVYAVPLTYEYDNVFDAYLGALETTSPDSSATNIAGALEYAKELFEHPKTGKIVIVTDGKETDGKTLDAISDVVAQGITVDLMYLSSQYDDMDAQILNVQMPEQHVELGKTCEIGVVVRCDEAIEATIKMYDKLCNKNEDPSETESSKTLSLAMGEQTIFFKHSFEGKGLHEIRFQLEFEDGRVMNNEYCSYYNVKLFNKILIFESEEGGDSSELITLLNENPDYEISVMNIKSSDVPSTVNAMRAYDQIIMNNVAESELPVGFDENLKNYVEVYGGGLLTVGGNDGDGNAHIYNQADSLKPYHRLFPIQSFNYTPPIGVMFVLDSSGSMMAGGDDGVSYFRGALQGVAAALGELHDKDHVGIMTLDSDYTMILEMTPRTQETKIMEALSRLEQGNDAGDTVFSNAIRGAGDCLRALKNVAKRHVIIVSDGQTQHPNTYLPLVKEFNETDGITFSFIGVHMEKDVTEEYFLMKDLTTLGDGRMYVAHKTTDFIDAMEEDLFIPTVLEKNEEEFNPIVYNPLSPLVQDLGRLETDKDRLAVTLNGFYGGKVKEGADLILMGDYEIPIYAQWKRGKGTVGSFMCDLQETTWSKAFMNDKNGKKFIHNVVNNLMPMEDIRPNEISVNLREDNYTNTLNIFPNLKEGETIKGELVQITADGEKAVSLNDTSSNVAGATFYTKVALSNNYSKCQFVVKESGVYAIRLTKYDKDGKQVGNTYEIFKTFSYSAEYDETLLLSEADQLTMLTSVTEKGQGTLIQNIEDVDTVLKGYITRLERVFDPRFSFMIMAIVFFLLDIVVCKFKFKWIHEIIRDRKRKNELK